MSLFPNEPKVSLERDFAHAMGLTESYNYLRRQGVGPLASAKSIVDLFFEFDWVKLWDEYENCGRFTHFKGEYFGKLIWVGDAGNGYSEINVNGKSTSVYDWTEYDEYNSKVAKKIKAGIANALMQIGEFELRGTVKSNQL